jgi:hypothetical protein
MSCLTNEQDFSDQRKLEKQLKIFVATAQRTAIQ